MKGGALNGAPRITVEVTTPEGIMRAFGAAMC
jgi:hypothetical protein